MRQRTQDTASSYDGFTLVEVVVSLALGALLLTAVQALVARSQQTERLLRARAVQAAQNDQPFVLLREDLLSRPLGAVIELTQGQLHVGSLNALQAERPIARQSVDVTYRFESDELGAHTLTRSERARSQPTPPSIAVASGLAGGSFQVFDGRQWLTEWRARDGRTAVAVALTVRRSPSAEEVLRVYPLAPPAWRHHRAR